jgi:hypothetical protein
MEYVPLLRGEIENYLKRRPQYEFIERRAGALVCGEVVEEPILGLARVSALEHPAPSFVQVHWSDDHGPNTAAARYPVDRTFCVRAPGPVDRLRIQRGLDRASWTGSAIPASTARLIAVHLHRGPTSLLYDFAFDGAVSDALIKEIQLIGSEQPEVRRWAAALAWYCRTRDYRGPLSNWIATAQAPAPDTAPTQRPTARSQPGTTPNILATKRIPTEMAMRLMDASFALGLAAGRSGAKSRRIRALIRDHAQGVRR